MADEALIGPLPFPRSYVLSLSLLLCVKCTTDGMHLVCARGRSSAARSRCGRDRCLFLLLFSWATRGSLALRRVTRSERTRDLSAQHCVHFNPSTFSRPLSLSLLCSSDHFFKARHCLDKASTFVRRADVPILTVLETKRGRGVRFTASLVSREFNLFFFLRTSIPPFYLLSPARAHSQRSECQPVMKMPSPLWRALRPRPR